ncbi:hypothetical protein WG909_06470 [Peptostreptococcaceae bacterium AGR-M142]
MEDFFKSEFKGYRSSPKQRFTFRIYSKLEFAKIVIAKGHNNHKFY